MPDRNGLSLWVERDAEFQLKAALQAFERAFLSSDRCGEYPLTFRHTEVWMHELKTKGKIVSVDQLASKCRMELFNKTTKGDRTMDENNKKTISQANSVVVPLWKNPKALQCLSAFLPSSIGFRCFQLADEAVQRVETGLAKAAYVHRGSKRGEKWIVSNGCHLDRNGCCWTLNVDCAGFVRNVIKSVAGSDMVISLSDRDYMRAKVSAERKCGSGFDNSLL